MFFGIRPRNESGLNPVPESGINPDFFLKSRFFLLITKENNIFLSYHHDFKSPIEQSELNNKKKFLNDIKRLFEK